MKSKTSVFVAIAVILGYFGIHVFMVMAEVKAGTFTALSLDRSLQFLQVIITGIGGYYWGSSEGSQRKDEFKFKVHDGYRKAQEAEEADKQWQRNFGPGSVREDGDKN